MGQIGRLFQVLRQSLGTNSPVRFLRDPVLMRVLRFGYISRSATLVQDRHPAAWVGLVFCLGLLSGCQPPPGACSFGSSILGCPPQPPSPPTIQLSPPTPGAGWIVSTLSCNYGGTNTCLGAADSVSIQVLPD